MTYYKYTVRSEKNEKQSDPKVIKKFYSIKTEYEISTAHKIQMLKNKNFAENQEFF